MSDAQWTQPVAPVTVGPGLVAVASLNATPSAGFVAWLRAAGASLVVSTGDKLLTIGVRDDQIAVSELRFDVVMGLAVSPDGSLLAASRWQLHELHDALAGSRGPGGEDRMLFNQVSHTTGFVGIRDVAVDRTGRVLFTTALCNGVATLTDRGDLDLVARPPFVSEAVVEERCHALGLGLDDGELAYLTAAAETDEAGGWLGMVADGGVVVDVRADKVLTRGLSLPCSPRVHGDRLYVTDGGTGELLHVDRGTGAASSVVTLPGIARGLAFIADRAVVGCSVPPDEGPYAALPVSLERPAEPRHGIAVVDVDAGRVEHTLTITGGSGEVHAVAVVEQAQLVGIRWQHIDAEGWFVLETTTG
ncbi:hypothetical protein GCM10009641_70780 [Mycobacterium cookii]|uniref:Conserved hypothetical protein CHP03032 domain-containing protein n=1 Tax=Nocardioides furvisabuli TaxID=375542 RepID=A0ABP5IAL0_9ACTN|nr:DUF4915 domain-containing protein [Nocardioides furvisabuli]